MTGERVSSELLVTGCVVAVLGTETSNGDFHVMDIKFPEYAPQPARMVKSSQRPKYLAIASGLELDGKGTDDRKVAMLTEFLSGEIGGDFDQHFAADVTMLILAGSTIGSTLAKKDPGEYSSDKPLFDDSPIAQFDEIINKLASSLPVAVMPGDGDPVNLTIPQQPFHKALFHSSKRFLEENNNLVTTTNPFWWEVDGVRIFGSSGQMINDIYKYSEDNDRLRMLDYTLRWRNCAPTAPDTLYTYPFVDKDPFIMNETPHVYFAGNQPSFATKMATGRDGENNDIEVRLIAVPRFSQTGQVVLLNLDTLEARPVTFQCD
jgi:DNA polymerase delta subunit 2